MKRTLRLLPLLLLAPLAALHAAEHYLVHDGQTRAEIVIAEMPKRTVRLAAQELQNGIEKICGAHLAIVTKPRAQLTHVFVGRSEHTDRLKVTAEGLKDGAYRIASGEDWMALLGEDTEFAPIEPWAKGNQELTSGKAQQEWNTITGAEWGLPNRLMYKDRLAMPGETGLPESERKAGARLAPLYVWGFDERGSFNAVCGFLMKLGVRWYAPDELGEVMPSMKTIALPKIDETTRPDFALRRVNIKFGVHGQNLAMWAMRLGARDPYGVPSAHGMADMTNREEVFAKHPDWFAMMGGRRLFTRGANNHLCYSNDELIAETVRNVRAQFDHFKVDMVSVMPPDGYTAICQCPLCAGKDVLERGNRGLAADYIWGFVNRVAKEVRKTHPDKKVHNCAYGIYSEPPRNIEKLEPNVVVSIVGGRRLTSDQPEEIEDLRKLRESWLRKTSNPIIIFENYPFTDRGWYLPTFTPHSMGTSINATKGTSQGEDVWLSVPVNFEKSGMGLNHFLVYFTQRMYWGGKDANADAMFREYVRLFYGPAEAEMNAFFDFCEANWQAMEKEKDKTDSALALFEKAKVKPEAASIYGKRLALLDDYLKGLRNKSQQLGKLRGPVPVLRLVGEARTRPVIDGQLDDEAWVNAFPSATVRLRELQTGRQPVFGTTAKATWIGHDLYLAIRCDEHRGEKPHIGTTRKDDGAIWYGDAVEVLMETESHSYYQIAVSPSGAIADLDRSAAKDRWFTWDSNAEVATRIEDDHWTVEMRLPITQDENDPLHQIIGHEPNKSLPWHINICRQRIREDGTELSAFSPTGANHFHDVMKFATFFHGNSHEFDHGPADDDFLEKMRAAGEISRTGKRDEALAAYTAAADGKFTDVQKSHALELAANLARNLRMADVAEQLIARIPIPAAKKSAQMQHLLDFSQAPQLIEQFAKEDISAWPFWKRGDGYFARGRAHMITKSGREAEADLTHALEWISDTRTRDSVLLNLAQNRESNLHDEDAALKSYRDIIADHANLGTADQFYALNGIALILTKHGQFDEALATLRRVDPTKLQGFWHSQFLLWQADTLLAASRKDDARAAYKSVADDASADPRLRKLADEKSTALK